MIALSLRIAATFTVLCLSSLALSAETAPVEGSPEDIRQVIEEYCVAVSDVAAERRMVNQTTALKELETRLEEKIRILEQEKSALEVLLKRRDELRNLAKRELVEIYAVMDAEAASQQLEQLDLRLASSVLRQLKPRQASAILNEMNPETAARMAKIIASTVPGGNESQ